MSPVLVAALVTTLFAAQAEPVDRIEPPPFEIRGTTAGTELWLVPAAQLVVRSELIGARDLSGTAPATPIQQRTRFGFDAGAGELLSMRLRLQDVRFWGGELLPGGGFGDPARFGTTPIDIEMFEGYFALHMGGLEVRVGRQVLHLDRGRLIGEAPWAMKSRAFDMARGIWRVDRHEMTAFGAVLQDADAPSAGLPTLPEQWLLGGHGRFVVIHDLVAHPVLVVDANTGLQRLRWTLGALVDGDPGPAHYEVEAYYQGADVANGLTNGYFVGALATWGFDPVVLAPRLGGLVSVASGDTDRTSTQGISTFQAPFGSRHWPLGLADLFVNLPRDTNDQGLIDLAPIAQLGGDTFYAEAQFHLFSAASPANVNASPLYGFEPDLVGGLRIGRHLELQAGGAVFVPLGPALGRGNQLMPWVYAMVTGQL